MVHSLVAVYLYRVVSIRTLNFFSEFSCKAVAEELRKQLPTLRKLNYEAMKTLLIAKGVIADQEMRIIDVKIGHQKMTVLLVDIIIPSLKVNNSEKYKGFLEAMEESDDSDVKCMAKKFGKLDHYFDGTVVQVLVRTRFNILLHNFSKLAG